MSVDQPVQRNRHLSQRERMVAGLRDASDTLWADRRAGRTPDAYYLGVIDRAILDLEELDARGLIGGFDV